VTDGSVRIGGKDVCRAECMGVSLGLINHIQPMVYLVYFRTVKIDVYDWDRDGR
jgi:hypothetical protein